MARMNIGYDLLTWEGDILRLHFWAHAFEYLKKTGAVYLQTEGKLKGCWVMRIEEGQTQRTTAEGAARTAEERAGKGHRPLRRYGDVCREGHGLSAVEVRAARQGLPLPDLRERRRSRCGRRRRIPRPQRTPTLRPSGARRGSATSSTPGSRTCRSWSSRRWRRSAITSRRTIRSTIRTRWSRCPIETARELGQTRAPMPTGRSSRCLGGKGLGVKADDLLDRLRDKAATEVAKRNPDLADGPGPSDRRGDRHGGRPVFHGEVLARQDHRLRHRRGAELRR